MILPRPTPSRSLDRTPFFKHPFVFLLSRVILGAAFGWLCASLLGGHGIFSVRGNGDVSRVYGKPFPKFLTKGDCSIEVGVLKTMDGFVGGMKIGSELCHRRKDILGSVNDGDSGGCQLPYYPTERICIILERFPTILFVGDEVAQSLYTTFNILLREDLESGGLKSWEMNGEEKSVCKCEKQFGNSSTCGKFQVREVDEVTNWSQNSKIKGGFLCPKTPHIHIPSSSAPLTTTTIQTFKNLTSNTHNPWQPTPLLLSLPPSFSLSEITETLEEWIRLVREARRNIPILYLPPPARNGKERWQYEKEIMELAGRLRFEVLNLGGLSGGGTGESGKGKEVVRRELERGMGAVGWLAFLESS